MQPYDEEDWGSPQHTPGDALWLFLALACLVVAFSIWASRVT